MNAPFRFTFNETKCIETLTFLASQWEGVTKFYAAKVLFYAEKLHLNRYGRPIVADTFVKLEDGPVLSRVYDFFKGNHWRAQDIDAIEAAVSFGRHSTYVPMHAKREPVMDLLSETDVECLIEAIEKCRGMDYRTLSDMTHKERYWQKAVMHSDMDYALMIDEDNMHKDEVYEEALSFAAYGAL